MKCAVPMCINKRNHRSVGVSYHKFPKNVEQRQKWLEALNRVDLIPYSSMTICSNHFNENDTYILTNRRYLHNGAVPSLHLGRSVNNDNRPMSLISVQWEGIKQGPAFFEHEFFEPIENEAKIDHNLIFKPDKISFGKTLKVSEKLPGNSNHLNDTNTHNLTDHNFSLHTGAVPSLHLGRNVNTDKRLMSSNSTQHDAVKQEPSFSEYEVLVQPIENDTNINHHLTHKPEKLSDIIPICKTLRVSEKLTICSNNESDAYSLTSRSRYLHTGAVPSRRLVRIVKNYKRTISSNCAQSEVVQEEQDFSEHEELLQPIKNRKTSGASTYTLSECSTPKKSLEMHPHLEFCINTNSVNSALEVLDDQLSENPSDFKRLRAKLNTLRKCVKDQKKKIKSLQQNIRRKDKKIFNLKQFLIRLNGKN